MTLQHGFGTVRTTRAPEAASDRHRLVRPMRAAGLPGGRTTLLMQPIGAVGSVCRHPSTRRDLVDDDFEQFYNASYQRLVWELFAVTGGDLPEAEDVLQEAYVRASLHWKRIRTYQAPDAWVRRVALNLASSAARRTRRRAAALLRVAPSPPVPGSELSTESLDLGAGLRALPMSQRQAIVLHHLVGLSVEEIAGQLHLPSGTVKSRLARGRKTLARHLGVTTSQGVQSHG
jgi:RNA polymerase sigma-70 factor (ECF subfamily)